MNTNIVLFFCVADTFEVFVNFLEFAIFIIFFLETFSFVPILYS